MGVQCIIDPGEVATVDEAVTILKREIADGAVGFGEHYGVGLMFDDPKNLMLYEACEKVGLPVMFHIDQNKNMVEPGMQRVDNVLKLNGRSSRAAVTSKADGPARHTHEPGRTVPVWLGKACTAWPLLRPSIVSAGHSAPPEPNHTRAGAKAADRVAACVNV